MILTHPLSTTNEANKKAIEKYKDRLVYVKHGGFNLWLTDNPSSRWQVQKNRSELTFKQALKLTKTYNKESKIEYHFISSQLGEDKFSINDFSQENVYDCTTVKFDKYHQPHTNKRTGDGE